MALWFSTTANKAISCSCRLCRPRLLGFLVLSAITATTHAQLDQPETFAQVGPSLLSFHYKETAARNAVLDREDGLLPGIEISSGIRTDLFAALIAASFHGGTITYDGKTQTGSPLTTDTRESIADVAISITRAIGPSDYSPQLVAGFGYREWRRDIQSTNSTVGLFEVYRWTYWMLGVEADVLRNDSWNAGIDWRLMRPVHPTIEVEVPGFDPLTLELGSGYSMAIGLPIEYRLGAGRSIVVRPYWQSWYLERSDFKRLYAGGSPTGFSAQEPDSETMVFGVSTLLNFSF